MAVACAVQIVEHCGKNNFKVKKEALKKIYGNERVSNLPLVVLCIAGAARKGKSFILNFFLDFLIHTEQFPNKSWIINETTKLNGFEFKDGEDRMTLGIWAWNHIFVIQNSDGKKVAVSLIDSQGTFDKHTSYEDCSAIFAMTLMFSSVMAFNVFTDLQEDKLNDFAAFIEHGKLITQNLGGSGKLFQNLVFIIRDFNLKNYFDDEENGGQKYVENQLGDVENEDLQKVRNNLKDSCERMFGFIFPYPGEKVAQEKTSKISEMDQRFVKKAKAMVETLLSQTNIQTKKLGNTQIFCKDMIEYISSCVKCFNDNPKFAPKAVQNVNREFLINLQGKRAIQAYENLMDEIFINNENGYEKPEIFKTISDTKISVIKNAIDKLIKDKQLCSEVVEKFQEEIKNMFPKYLEKNRLLVEKEKERQEYKRKEAENEKQQAKLRDQMEQERKDRRKQDAETARIQTENITKLEKVEQKLEEKTTRLIDVEASLEKLRQAPPTVIYVQPPPVVQQPQAAGKKKKKWYKRIKL